MVQQSIPYHSDQRKAKNVLKAQISKYILGGFSTAVLYWGSVLLFVEVFHIHYLISANIPAFYAWIYAYFINKYFVYGNYDKSHVTHGGKFILLQIFLCVLGNLLLYIGVDIFKFHYFLVNVLVAGFASLINFIVMKMMVFT